MKFDVDYMTTYTTRDGKPWYTFKQISTNVGAFESPTSVQFFELDTHENIGGIYECDNRTNFKKYYSATCLFGWSGKGKDRKQFVKTLCTKADYRTAYALLMEEYKNRIRG